MSSSYQQSLHPWVVYQVLPNMQNVRVEAFRKRHDADAYVKALQGLYSDRAYTVAFSQPTEQSA